MDLPRAIERCFDCPDPGRKVALVHALYRDWSERRLDTDALTGGEPRPVTAPGRPPRPRLVSPRELPRRRLGSIEGRAALLHAVAHIEFNAIHLALDAAYRFRGLPGEYYADWLRVADDEARHFSMVVERLAGLGFGYGDFPAHNGLWEMAEETAHDVMVRMALVPRVLEARGLDVTPGMMERLRSAGDEPSAEVLARILREEIPHVAIGSRWYRHFCGLRGLPPESTFRGLLQAYMRGRLKGPFNVDARMAAGFSAAELKALAALTPDSAGQ